MQPQAWYSGLGLGHRIPPKESHRIFYRILLDRKEPFLKLWYLT